MNALQCNQRQSEMGIAPERLIIDAEIEPIAQQMSAFRQRQYRVKQSGGHHNDSQGEAMRPPRHARLDSGQRDGLTKDAQERALRHPIR